MVAVDAPVAIAVVVVGTAVIAVVVSSHTFVSIHSVVLVVVLMMLLTWALMMKNEDRDSVENMQITLSKSGQSLRRQWKFEYAKILKKMQKQV